jgi:hypothetical protein
VNKVSEEGREEMRSLCPGGVNLSLSATNEVSEVKKKANCLAFGRDEKSGAMFREYAKPRAGVAEIYERRRVNYL